MLRLTRALAVALQASLYERLLRPPQHIGGRSTGHDARMGVAAAVCFVFCGVACVGGTGACHPGVIAHYGSDAIELLAWAESELCTGCAEGRCECAAPSTRLNCSHPVCGERRAQVLLTHEPVGCGDGATAAWGALRQQCATLHGKCCNHAPCAVPRAARRTARYTAREQFTASLYVGLASLLAALALLRDEATTVREALD